jgi:hypothetical protein
MNSIFTTRTLLILQVIATVCGIIWIGIQFYDHFKKKEPVIS